MNLNTVKPSQPCVSDSVVAKKVLHVHNIEYLQNHGKSNSVARNYIRRKCYTVHVMRNIQLMPISVHPMQNSTEIIYIFMYFLVKSSFTQATSLSLCVCLFVYCCCFLI